MQSQPVLHGVICPETYGAKADDLNDDTQAIQKAIDILAKNGGGTVCLGSGTYLVSSITLGPKVSFEGNGNGATVLKQKSGHSNHCLIVKDNAAALKISDFTILGNDKNSGIYFERSGGFGENHPYLYTNTSKWEKSQAYKWIKIDNVCVYHFGKGLEIEQWGFNINICNSTFSHCGNGVVMRCTDSSMYNCYVTNNLYNGVQIIGGNNKINNVKSIFNGKNDAKNSAAILVQGDRCQIENCETQDNFCKGFHVKGISNLFSNCISNTDGYCKVPITYVPEVEACGFRISSHNNSFSNCAVTSYTEKYGAVYHKPIIVDEAYSYLYPSIYNNIKVLIPSGMLLFHEPFVNVQSLASKNKIENLHKETINQESYFYSTQQKDNIIKDIDVCLSNLNILIDFKSFGSGGRLIDIDENFKVTLDKDNRKIKIWSKENSIAELVLEEKSEMRKDDIRLVVCFNQNHPKKIINMVMFENTGNRGWLKKRIKKEVIIPTEWIRESTIRIGDVKLPVKRIAITHSPIPESVVLPSSNTNQIYGSAVVYVDADTAS